MNNPYTHRLVLEVRIEGDEAPGGQGALAAWQVVQLRAGRRRGHEAGSGITTCTKRQRTARRSTVGADIRCEPAYTRVPPRVCPTSTSPLTPTAISFPLPQYRMHPFPQLACASCVDTGVS